MRLGFFRGLGFRGRVGWGWLGRGVVGVWQGGGVWVVRVVGSVGTRGWGLAGGAGLSGEVVGFVGFGRWVGSGW